jgi:hypothetical protein
VLILPFVDNGQIYNQYRFDEPWDGPHNRLLSSMLGSSYGTIYHCPSDLRDGTRDELLTTSYVAVIGPETAWNGSRSTKLEEVTDGAADTILIVEVANSGIPWMEPRDLHVTQMPATVNARAGMGISSAHPGGAHIMTADDSIRWLPNSIPAKSIRGMLTIRGREKP